MSLEVGGCFQRGMSLNGSRWVDHGSHGDRHERDATVRAGAAQGFSGGDGGGPVPARRGRRGALLAPSGGAQAFCPPSAQAGEQRAGAALSGSHHGLFTAAADPPGAAVLGLRRAHQALPSASTGLCAKVHGRRCGASGRDRRPARHALGTRHQAFDAARFLRGHPAWRRPRTAPSYASASATATSRSVLRCKSTASVPRTSTPTSTSTGPAHRPGRLVAYAGTMTMRPALPFQAVRRHSWAHQPVVKRNANWEDRTMWLL